MFNLLLAAALLWLLGRAVGLALRITWGAMRLAAGILTALALPLLILSLLLAGGITLLIPAAALAISLGILTAWV